ncbi:KaiB domain protein [Chondrocystis sp. NIES-4102]|nr:KaiB domain protein [Chondrocystis sp. NIES-4102]
MMTNVIPNIFKGIALFTPGGDLIYGIDPSKNTQWHSHLCLGLQENWGLVDSPHFLVPGYTATVERWLDPQTQQIKTIAEIYPSVQRYIPLLQVLFNLEPTTTWHLAPWLEEHCNRAIIETYRAKFPQLWEQRDLIIRHDPLAVSQITISPHCDPVGNYVFRLFISSDNLTAEKTLGNVHQLLEQGLDHPYTLKVIDIKNNPEQAIIHQIALTPTLVRIEPKPIKRIVGQFDDIPRILSIINC